MVVVFREAKSIFIKPIFVRIIGKKYRPFINKKKKSIYIFQKLNKRGKIMMMMMMMTGGEQ